MLIEGNAKIAAIGLGYVGLPPAVEFGKHRAVLGFEINPVRIAELQSGGDSTLEVEPYDLVAASQLRFSSQAADLKTCQVLIVTGGPGQLPRPDTVGQSHCVDGAAALRALRCQRACFRRCHGCNDEYRPMFTLARLSGGWASSVDLWSSQLTVCTHSP